MVNDRIRKVFFIAQFEFKASFCAFVLHCTTYVRTYQCIYGAMLDSNSECKYHVRLSTENKFLKNMAAKQWSCGGAKWLLTIVFSGNMCDMQISSSFSDVQFYPPPIRKCKLWLKSLPKLTLAHKVCRRDYRVNSMENRKQEQTLLKRSAAGFD